MTAPTPEIVEMAHQFLRFSVISGSPVSFNPPDLRALLDHVAAVTAERDQARQMLADAPHADDCTYLEEDVVEPYGTRISPNAHCNCWKAGL
jgi:hypothetical protein